MMARYLLLTRLEAGDLEPHPTAFSLAETVRHVCTPFRKQAREKGLTFKLNRLPASTVIVYMDRFFLTQILQELLSNSVTFTRKGGIALILETEGHTLRLRVSDTGVGTPEAALPAVFSGFRHSPKPTNTHAGRGPGTGLAFVWGLVDTMGGHLEAESREEQGSTFTVTLPHVITTPR